MKKTDYIANIAYANGTNAIIRRVWEDDKGKMFVKIEGTYRPVRYYNASSEFICKLLYEPCSY